MKDTNKNKTAKKRRQDAENKAYVEEEAGIRGYNPRSLACEVAREAKCVFEEEGRLWYCKGGMLLSPLMHSFGVVDLDCLKWGVDEEMVLDQGDEWPHRLHFVVSQNGQDGLILRLKRRIREICGYKVYGYYHEGQCPCLYPWRFVVSRKGIRKEDRILITHRGRKISCLGGEYVKRNIAGLLVVDLTSVWRVGFIERMRRAHPLIEAEKGKLKELEEARRRKLLAVFGEKDGPLLFDKELHGIEDYLCCLLQDGNSTLLGQIKRMEAIEWLAQLEEMALYFLACPDLSYRLYFTEFLGCKITKKGTIIPPKNETMKSKVARHIKNYHFDVADRYVGIFFLIEGKLYMHKQPLADDGSEFIDCPMGHFEFFASLGLDDTYEYSMFPRGRVLYSNKERCFHVYCDKAIIDNDEALEGIWEAFALPLLNVKLMKDEHYRTLPY